MQGSAYSALAPYYDQLSGHDFDQWRNYVVGMLNTNGVKRTQAVLDAACGTGKLTLSLYFAGFVVTGLDASDEMLSVAAERFSKAGAAIPLVRGDLTDLPRNKKYHAITCNCDGVNYLLEESRLSLFLEGAYRCMHPGGALLFDVSTEDKLRAMGGQQYSDEWQGGLYLWTNTYDHAQRVVTMELTVFSREPSGLYRREDEVHQQRAWRVEELQNALEKAGFTAAFYDGFSGDLPRENSQRIHVLARKV